MSFAKSSDSKNQGSSAVADFAARASSSPQLEAFLGEGCQVVGTLSFSGPVELNGRIEGEVNAKGRLVIGEAARVNAKITGSDIVVKGTVEGDIIASTRLSLQKPAKITGNISCASLTIEEGVVFEGKCNMNSQSAGGAAANSD